MDKLNQKELIKLIKTQNKEFINYLIKLQNEKTK